MTCYEVLGLKENANEMEIKEAYKEKINYSANDYEQIILINEIYLIISSTNNFSYDKQFIDFLEEKYCSYISNEALFISEATILHEVIFLFNKIITIEEERNPLNKVNTFIKKRRKRPVALSKIIN